MTRMTRKHFEVIARAISTARSCSTSAAALDTIQVWLDGTAFTRPQAHIVQWAIYNGRDEACTTGDQIADWMTNRICIELALTNEQFDADRFKEACK